MAHFYGEITGNKGTATRMGSQGSGFRAHIRGWNMGIEVFLNYNEENDRDEATVYLTGGSNGRTGSILIGTFIMGKKLRVRSSLDPRPRIKRISLKTIKIGEARRVEALAEA